MNAEARSLEIPTATDPIDIIEIFEGDLEDLLYGFFEYEVGEAYRKDEILTKKLIAHIRAMLSQEDRPTRTAAIIFKDIPIQHEAFFLLDEYYEMEKDFSERFLKVSESEAILKASARFDKRYKEQVEAEAGSRGGT